MPDDEVKVQITSDASQMQGGVDDAKSAIDDLSSSVKSASDDAIAGLQSSVSDMASSVTANFSQVGESAKDLLEVFGGFLSVHWAVGLVTEGADAAESLTNMAARTGASTVALAHLRDMAAIAGVPLESFTAAIRRATAAYDELATGHGSPQLLGAMQQLGLAKNDLLDFPSLLEKISEAESRVGEAAIRVDVGAIFSRGGLQLLPVIENYKTLSEAASQLGVVLTSSMIEQGNKSAEAMNALGESWRNAKTLISADLEPQVENLSGGMGRLTIDVQAAIEIFGGLLTVLQKGADALTFMGLAVTDAQEKLENYIATATGFASSPVAQMQNALSGSGPSSPFTPGASAQPKPQPPTPPPPMPVVQTGAQVAAAAKKALDQQFADVKAEAAEEIAEAGNTAQAKIQFLQQVVDFARTAYGEQSKQALSAAAEEMRARDEYRKQLQADVASEAQDVATMQNSQLAITKSTLAQELAEHKITKAAELAAEMQVDDQVIANKLRALQVTQQSLDEGTKAYERNAAEIIALSNELTAKQIADQTKVVDANQQAAKQSLSSWQSAMGAVADAIDQMVRGVLQGTQSISQMFERMVGDILLSLAKSGIKDLLVGGTAPAAGQSASLAYSMFGGGFAGILQSAWQTAVASSAGSFASVISGAFSAAAGALRSVFTSIFSAGAGSLLGGAGASAGGAATSGITQALTQAFESSSGALSGLFNSAFQSSGGTIMSLFSQGFSGSAGVISSIFSEAFSGIGGLGGGAGLLGLLALERGGVVPSAAGGMVLGGGMGGVPAILHPRETVLPANISEAMQRAIGGGSFGGGGHTVNVHLNVNALDGANVMDMLQQYRDEITDMVAEGVTSGRGVQQGYGFR